MHRTHFSSILKSTIALASMLGISSVIGVQTLPFISPESNGRPRPFPEESHGRPRPFPEESHGRPRPFPEESHGRPRPFPEESNGRPRPFPEQDRAQSRLSWKATSASYQPPAEPVSEPAQEPPAALDFPPSLQPQTPPPDLENDPVFQEIKKAFMPGANTQSQPTQADSSSIASIPDSQWHAAEHLLRAARELEAVENAHIQNRNASQATKIREWILQIRTTASQLIQAP